MVITDPKTKRYIRVMVAHAPSAYKVQVYMCLFRLICSAPVVGNEESARFDGWHKPSVEKVAEKTLINFVKVGDFSISNRPETVRFLRYIPSEVESEIIFMLGNTVIGIQDSNPSKSVLKLVKFIDKEVQNERLYSEYRVHIVNHPLSQSCMRYIKRIFAAASASMSPASP